MKQVLQVREHIYSQFQNSSAPMHFFKPENTDDYAAYYTSMYLIQDTGEAVLAHMDQGFSQKPLQAYIEFWGVMQATFIQQDAIRELHRAVLGNEPDESSLPAWCKLRDTRNLCAGHPAKRSHRRQKPQRAFMGREFGTYNQIRYEVWDASVRRSSHPTFDLSHMIGEYDTEASKVLQDVLGGMEANWP